MSEKVLDYPLTEAKADIVDGERETPVEVNTAPQGSVVNTVTVSEVKKIVRDAIDHFEQEEGGVTEAEMETYVKNAEINVSQLGTNSGYQGQYLQVQSDGSVIPAGTGGTKLYKHSVVVTISDSDTLGSDQYTFVVLDTKSTALTMNEIIALKPVCIGLGGSLTVIIGLCFPVEQNSSFPYGLCDYKGDALGQGASVSDVTFSITDDVTEL